VAGLDYDVVVFDSVSSVYTEESPLLRGLGGSELCVITLTQELARHGFTVLVLNDPIELRSKGNPEPTTPIVAPSGVHYASCRGELPPITCGTLIIQRFSEAPSDPRYDSGPNPGIKRDRTVVWVHDACNNASDFPARAVAAAISRPLNKGGAIPVFISRWERGIYPPDAVGHYSRVIPNLMPRLLFEDRWKEVPQQDTMVYASAAMRGLDATLRAWADPRVVAAGNTVLEIMGPRYDPPPDAADELNVRDEQLQGRVRLCGSQTLAGLLEHMASSRGLIYASQFLETFCMLVAYSEALGKPVRFIGLLPDGIAGVRETMQHQRFLYEANEVDRFIEGLALEIKSEERLSVPPVRKFHPDNVMPMWFEALGLDA
jgi:glycosyltransferase involved in cell wall biosynthesis